MPELLEPEILEQEANPARTEQITKDRLPI
jgi:hypothetical protein